MINVHLALNHINIYKQYYSMAINASTNLIAVQTSNAIKLIDPKTSSIL